MTTVRRFLLAAILVSDHTTVQLIAYRVMTVLILIYAGYVRASWSIKYDLLHEFLFVTQGVLLPVFTDFVPDPHTRHQVGWVSAGFFAF